MITPQELADKHIGEYKIRNGNITAKYCPFCKGGKNNDKYTFGISQENGAYNCFRGKCGAKGSFYDLCKHFGEEYDFDDDKFNKSNYNHNSRKNKSKKKKNNKSNNGNKNVKLKDIPLKSKVAKYLKKRQISEKTWKKRKVKMTKKKGRQVIAFPYYKKGKLVLIKYRTASKKKRYWQEGGGKPVLWGMDQCNKDKPLLITEGEADTLAIVEAGYNNVVSVPFGSQNLDWIEECWDFLEQFEKIIIWTDNDEAGKDMEEKVVSRLGRWRCYTVDCKYNDANLLLYKKGKNAIRKVIKNAKAVPIERIINVADVEPIDLAKMEACKSGIGKLNKLLGGYILGYISVWTGENSSGKSTFLSQEMLESIEQGYGACVYSGELDVSFFQWLINLQAAGPDNFRMKYNEAKEDMVPTVPGDIRNKITDWYDKKLFYYDIYNITEPDKILETFENIYRRYGVKSFFIDNLMTINYGGRKSEYYHRQSEFVGRCKEFARRLNVHVHIVAHPKKTKNKVTKMDVAGLAEITNKTDNALVIHRLDDENKKEFNEELRDCDSIIDVLKSRIYGKQKVSIGLGFEENTRRFYIISNEDRKFKSYGWEDGKNQRLE